MIKFIKALSLVLKMGPDKILKLQEESRTDSLTGLLNRRGFRERLEIEKVRSDRYGHRFMLVYLDLDDLKKINDLQGHHEGDRALVSLAEVIKRNCRFTDFAGRLGGDEFAIVFSETEEKDDKMILERLGFEVGNASIGHSHYCGGSISVDGVVRHAETMMREAKKGRKAKGRD